jgi:hypothetical protein
VEFEATKFKELRFAATEGGGHYVENITQYSSSTTSIPGPFEVEFIYLSKTV